MRIQSHQAEAQRYNAAGTAAGVSMHEAQAKAQLKRQNETTAKMADEHFKVLRTQKDLAEQARMAKQITELDTHMALHTASIAPANVAARLAQAQNISFGGGQTGQDSSSSGGPDAYSIVPLQRSNEAMDAGVTSDALMSYDDPESKWREILKATKRRKQTKWTVYESQDHLSEYEKAKARINANRKSTALAASSSGPY